MNLGLYLHIPFCRQKCLYCDFPSGAAAEETYQHYTAALCREIAGGGGILSRYEVDTIYVGGGTPTILPVESLAEIINCLKANCRIRPDAEISIEANPGTVNRAALSALRASGFNRLSIGVQSFDDNLLTALGRIHSAAEAEAAVYEAQAAGFANISIDLMYGLPGQTVDTFHNSLSQALTLPLNHISVYGLKVEEGTPFARMADEGRLNLPDEAAEEDMYQSAVTFLPQHGFNRYEISNYARAGDECRHNLKYWRYQPYLGLGAAAHSFISPQRWFNIAEPGEYIHRITHGESAACGSETPDTAVAMAEFTFLALRTVAGLSFTAFRRNFGIHFLDYYGDTVRKLSAQGLIRQGPEGIALTPVGMKYGNKVFASFLPE